MTPDRRSAAVHADGIKGRPPTGSRRVRDPHPAPRLERVQRVAFKRKGCPHRMHPTPGALDTPRAASTTTSQRPDRSALGGTRAATRGPRGPLQATRGTTSGAKYIAWEKRGSLRPHASLVPSHAGAARNHRGGSWRHRTNTTLRRRGGLPAVTRVRQCEITPPARAAPVT